MSERFVAMRSINGAFSTLPFLSFSFLLQRNRLRLYFLLINLRVVFRPLQWTVLLSPGVRSNGRWNYGEIRV